MSSGQLAVGPEILLFTTHRPLLASVFPQARIQTTRRRQQQPDEIFAAMTYSANGKTGRGNLLCSIFGLSGMFFAIAAPEEQFVSQKNTMIRVLEAFSFTQPSASRAGMPRSRRLPCPTRCSKPPGSPRAPGILPDMG